MNKIIAPAWIESKASSGVKLILMFIMPALYRTRARMEKLRALHRLMNFKEINLMMISFDDRISSLSLLLSRVSLAR